MKTGVKILDAMTQNLVIIKPEVSIIECAKIMEKQHLGGLLVKDEVLVGIITEQDIVRRCIAKGIDPNTEVKKIMETNLITIKPHEDIYEALVIMRDNNIRHLPVMYNGDLIGILTIKDILKIQPQLFEILVEKFEIRESSNKPLDYNPIEGECKICGNYSEISYYNGKWVCDACKL